MCVQMIRVAKDNADFPYRTPRTDPTLFQATVPASLAPEDAIPLGPVDEDGRIYIGM